MVKKKKVPFKINMIRPGMSEEEFNRNTIAYRLGELVKEEEAEKRVRDRERGKGNPLARLIELEEMNKEMDEMGKRR